MIDLIDYAKPLLDLEFKTKEVSNLCLHKDYGPAIELVRQMRPMLVELEVILKLMQEQEERWK